MSDLPKFFPNASTKWFFIENTNCKNCLAKKTNRYIYTHTKLKNKAKSALKHSSKLSINEC